MAKIAKCGYGSDGRGIGKTEEGYTYIVNDNVRTGDRIQVIATSRAQKKFATTAVPLHTYKETTVKGKQAKQDAITATGKDPTESYTGKELGVSKEGINKPTFRMGGDKQQSQYTLETRAGNIAKYMEKNPTADFSLRSKETFDAYSKKFMNEGER